VNGLLLTAVVTAPGIVALALALVWLLGWTPNERFIGRLTATVSLFSLAAAAWLAVNMLRERNMGVEASFGDWYHAGGYSFPLTIFADRLSLPLVVLTVILVGVVGLFSVRYVHREGGFFRFFLLLHLFSFGSLLVFTAASFDLLIGGWELVGITSVLLVAFFGERREPVRNAIRVFATYRIADLGLLLAIFFMHYLMGTADGPRLFPGEWPNQSAIMSGPVATLIGFLLLIGASGKSAQIPFSGWLPRAMEGPTPSSAIFYGAISVHAGAYLLLRSNAVFQAAPLAAAAVVVVGALTALLATLAHRVAVDAKTSLAYATMTQLGVIFVEIGLGFPMLALVHLMGHAVVRTLQFLRAPSMLHDYHRVHAAAGGDLGETGSHYHQLVNPRLQMWLYRAGLERGFLDVLADRLIVEPCMRLSRHLAFFDPHGPGMPVSTSKNLPVTPLTPEVEG